MAVFTFYLQDGADSIPQFEIEMFDHAADAIAHGERLLAERPRYKTVVVTEGETEVARIPRRAA